METKAYLVLENGQSFEGFAFGASGEVIGEIVFTTGMTGYIETLTDKSYCGQIITQTFPLIGNYGIIPEDFESTVVSARGYIVKNWCQEPSNFRCEGTLDTFLKEKNVVGLYGIDTRELTKILREQGTMNGMITTDLSRADLDKIKAFSLNDEVQTVSSKEITVLNEGGKYDVALIDFGYKENIVRELVERDCKITVFPQDTTAAEIIAAKPQGIMLSNGPGDPKSNTEVIENLKKLTQSGIPIFGICLGHQLIALSFGFETEKLKYGHRGANQPAKDISTGRTYITSQNHGYTVSIDSIDKNIAELWFVNVNDQTCEGIKYTGKPIFTVQFHPEGCSGPQDTGYLFDKFIEEVDSYAAM
ncbi:MAG: carbamoyl phosphate synthase small subunit [Oscillospiraceae bacterium]|nr:carbamoyl phosphate synthase small subunit [Oscillospiraceae bacterium]